MNNKLTSSRIRDICKSKRIAVSKLLADCNIRKDLIYDMEKRDAIRCNIRTDSRLSGLFCRLSAGPKRTKRRAHSRFREWAKQAR